MFYCMFYFTCDRSLNTSEDDTFFRFAVVAEVDNEGNDDGNCSDPEHHDELP